MNKQECAYNKSPFLYRKEFNLFKKTGIISSATKVKKEKVEVYQLSHKVSKIRLIHGNYALCMYQKKQLSAKDKEKYEIIPFKN